MANRKINLLPAFVVLTLAIHACSSFLPQVGPTIAATLAQSGIDAAKAVLNCRIQF